MSYLRNLRLTAHSGIQHVLCCDFVFFVFVLSIIFESCTDQAIPTTCQRLIYIYIYIYISDPLSETERARHIFKTDFVCLYTYEF